MVQEGVTTTKLDLKWNPLDLIESRHETEEKRLLIDTRVSWCVNRGDLSQYKCPTIRGWDVRCEWERVRMRPRLQVCFATHPLITGPCGLSTSWMNASARLLGSLHMGHGPGARPIYAFLSLRFCPGWWCHWLQHCYFAPLCSWPYRSSLLFFNSQDGPFLWFRVVLLGDPILHGDLVKLEPQTWSVGNLRSSL